MTTLADIRALKKLYEQKIRREYNSRFDIVREDAKLKVIGNKYAHEIKQMINERFPELGIVVSYNDGWRQPFRFDVTGNWKPNEYKTKREKLGELENKLLSDLDEWEITAVEMRTSGDVPEFNVSFEE